MPGNHAFKVGVDVRRIRREELLLPDRARPAPLPHAPALIDDVAEAANINKPLPGGEEVNYYHWWTDTFMFAQDEWRVRPSLTLSLGLRYELPGNGIDSLVDLNERIVQTAGGDQRFAFTPVPKHDKNNFQPRLGFNWNPQTSGDGMLGWITGGDKFVLRGGYARTHDYAFLNLALNIASSFPFVAAINHSNLPNAFTLLPTPRVHADDRTRTS